MDSSPERILVVESNPTISELIVNQALAPIGYQVQLVTDASVAIQETLHQTPDLILVDLNLPGLSGKDLLVALSSRGVEVPIVVVANQVKEGDIIAALRLGAVDFLSWPAGEVEVVSVVERVLDQVRSHRQKDIAVRQLNQTNLELQRRLRDLTAIVAIGKGVISVTDLRSLIDKILEGAVFVTEADLGLLLFKDEHTKNFILASGRNLPSDVSNSVGQPWDDGLSPLVALSGESLSIHGDPLKRFKISSLGQSILAVPIKVKHEVVGLLVMVRKSAQPFINSLQALLEAVADYASIAIVNARFFRALNDRVKSSQLSVTYARLGERISREMMSQTASELQPRLLGIKTRVNELSGALDNKILFELSALFTQIQADLETTAAIILFHANPTTPGRSGESSIPDLNDLVRLSVKRFQPLIRHRKINFQVEPSPFTLKILANSEHILYAIEGLLSNAVRSVDAGSQIKIQITSTADNLAQLTIQNQGVEGPRSRQESNFNDQPGIRLNQEERIFTGLGISMSLVNEIIKTYNGKTWVENEPGKGSVFILLLPCA